MKTSRILMGAAALTVVATLIIGCKKEESFQELSSNQIDCIQPQMRSAGHWVHVEVPGKRMKDAFEANYCIGDKGKCLEYNIWVEEKGTGSKSVYENEGYVFLPSTTEIEEEVYPTDVWLHVCNLKHDVKSGKVSFQVIE